MLLLYWRLNGHGYIGHSFNFFMGVGSFMCCIFLGKLYCIFVVSEWVSERVEFKVPLNTWQAILETILSRQSIAMVLDNQTTMYR